MPIKHFMGNQLMTGGGPWWDPRNVGLSVVGAWRAKGADNYAASLLDLTGNGNNLTEGNGPVTWTQATGWSFVAAQSKYFDTGLTPANDQSWSMLIQYANIVVVNSVSIGVQNGGTQNMFMQPLAGGIVVRYAAGNAITVGPQLATGNTGVLGDRGCRNGILEGAAIGGWGGASTRDIYIAALNNGGVAASFITGDVYAVVIYDGGAAAVQAEAALIAARMAVL